MKFLYSREVDDRKYEDGQFRIVTSFGKRKNELYGAVTFYTLKTNGEKYMSCFHSQLSMCPVLIRTFSIANDRNLTSTSLMKT